MCMRLRTRPVALAALACCVVLALLALLHARQSPLRLSTDFTRGPRDVFAVVVTVSTKKHVLDVRTMIRYWERERWPNGTLPCGSTKGPADNATAHVRPRPDLVIYSAQPLSHTLTQSMRDELHRAPRSR
ncbi:hypothetical protein CDCA_CDCA07G2200 [Cyanidium caldarium]|uniref:Hexosyltransferase n=1 Tax=Cyanidium caldarium TaxID=2771 RepID=A0AAV9IVQ0_CYACA|nr:hypothetical protein CDCA_CDCA07G2200 [Cyanidium caldarium]